MAIKFNADEVLEMAVKIEQNGAAYYRKASELKKGTSETGFLENLAGMEDEHQKVFSNMRTELSDSEKRETAYDPYGEAQQYLQEMADTHGGEGDRRKYEELSENDPLLDIIDTAIGMEKQSVLFYTSLIDMVPQRLGREEIDRIIKEERSHIGTLSAKREALS